MNTILWFIQVILAAIFASAGIIKILLPKEKLIKSGLKWVVRLPVYTVRFIGLSELFGAIGLILPILLNIYPFLTPLAACGLVLIMIFAAFHHYKCSENNAIVLNIIIMVLSAIVAIGRFINI